MAQRVLVVDDEKLIVKGIRFSLEQEGMEVDCAYDGEEANLQCEVAQKVIDDKLSVRELEKFIKDCKEKKVAKPHKKENEELNPYYKDITERLQGYFGTKVNISNKNNKGKIEIEYYSYEDLQRILDIIKL